MNELSAAILEEKEVTDLEPRKAPESELNISETKITTTKARILRMMNTGPAACIAFSGGGDSRVLLDLCKDMEPKPAVVWVDSQMEYPETRPYIEKTVQDLGFRLQIGRAEESPFVRWKKTGWPMLGKLAARLWMQKNRHAGFKINVSECCRHIKIIPGRAATRALGCGIQLTGQRGFSDDDLRGYRARADRDMFYHKNDKIWIANPLDGWTDGEIKAYTKQEQIQEHPAKKRGATAIGCIYCGGGSQFTNSEYRKLRSLWPEAWYKFMVEWHAGLIILALKYKTTFVEIIEAVRIAGGLPFLAETRPWVFDFTRKKPLPGHAK